MMTAEDFRAWRMTRRLTQAQVATWMDVTVRQVKRWEAGVTPVSRLVELATKGVDAILASMAPKVPPKPAGPPPVADDPLAALAWAAGRKKPAG